MKKKNFSRDRSTNNYCENFMTKRSIDNNLNKLQKCLKKNNEKKIAISQNKFICVK